MLTTQVDASRSCCCCWGREEESEDESETGSVGSAFRSCSMRRERIGLASSSFLLMPMPITSSLPPPPSLSAFTSPLAVCTARFSRSFGKWLIQLEQKSRMRPVRGRFWL